jgi:hypothetical protein
VTGAISVAVLAALLGLLGFAVARPSRATVEVERESVRVRLHGFDALLAVCREVVVPRSSVLGVRAAAKAEVPAKGIRLPGTGVPGLVRAGSFGTGARRELWDVRRAATYLVLDLAPGQRYRRIVLEVDDPVAEAARLQPLLAT